MMLNSKLLAAANLSCYAASPRWGRDRNLIDSRSQILSSAIARLVGHEGRDRLPKLKSRDEVAPRSDG